LGLLIALLLPAIQSAREAARRNSCANNITQLSKAVLSYEGNHQGFPSTAVAYPGSGITLPGPGGWWDNHGWYSMIAPHIGYNAWANLVDYSQSFSDADNYQARKLSLDVKIFECPSDRGLQVNEWLTSVPGYQNWARVLSNYVVNGGNTNFGQGTINVGGTNRAFFGAPFNPGKITALSQIVDGTARTLMFSEVMVLPSTPDAWGGSYSDVQTALGCHVFTGHIPPNSNNNDVISYSRNGGLPVLRANQRFLEAGFTVNNWPIITPGTIDPNLNRVTARSKHRGGVYTSRCDGSVWFLSDTINQVVWQALTTAQGSKANEPQIPAQL
jgi:hypothetical protein